MKILSINVIHFGMLSGYELNLDRSLHIIEGENETGKSTISAFIRYMLYGIDENDFLARLDDMVEQAFDDQCTGANPRYPLMSELKQMYLNAYYGRHFTEEAMPITDLDVKKADAVKAPYLKGKKA